MKNSRELILNKLRKSVLQKTEKPYPNVLDDMELFPIQDGALGSILKIALESIGAKCIGLNNLDFFNDWLELESKKREWNQLFCSEPELLTQLSKNKISISEEEKFYENSVAITYCEALIARTGSIIISSVKPNSRTHSIAADTHIVIAFQNQIKYDLADHISTIKSEKISSMLSVVSGPSRTADIEKTLVMGAHGPKELYVVIIG
jgi:L-lactate dehydrogenase complex protein LldG